MPIQQIVHIVRVFLLPNEYSFEKKPHTRIFVTEVANQLTVMIDRNALGDRARVRRFLLRMFRELRSYALAGD